MENAQSHLLIKNVFYSSRDGLKLHVKLYQPKNDMGNLPVICLPGLTRNARDFQRLALHLAGDAKTPRSVICFDLRGRGLSEYDPNWQNYNIITEAEDVVSGLTALGVEHGIFVGTSRGGLITFLLGAMRPGAIKAVVLNDIGPVIDGAGLMQIRSYLSRAPKPKTWAEAIQAQKSIMAKSFTAFTDEDWKFEAESRYCEKNGVIKSDFDPNIAKTLEAMNAGQRIPTIWPQFRSLSKLPMLAIRGENSNLLSSETIKAMQSVHPQMETMIIEGQGHAPMLHTASIPTRIAEFAQSADRSYKKAPQ